MKLKRSNRFYYGHTSLFLDAKLASRWVSLFHRGDAFTPVKAKYFMEGELPFKIRINFLNETKNQLFSPALSSPLEKNAKETITAK